MEFSPDRIRPSDSSLGYYLEQLLKGEYQIPTFQREVSWSGDQIKRLWDSIFRFYPIGSILVWKTSTLLQRHRKIGGFEIDKNFTRAEQKYLLDGQQRTTAMLTGFHGTPLRHKEEFDPTLYIDLARPLVEDDDDNYKERLLFWHEIDDVEGTRIANKGRFLRYKKGEVVALREILQNMGSVDQKLNDGDHPKYDDPVRKALRHAHHVLTNYRVSFIELTGIQIAEVCEIFERINREGKPLSTFDIVVAKTYRPRDQERGVSEFYLRKCVDDLRARIPAGSRYEGIDDNTLLQMLATVINVEDRSSGIKNITDKYLTVIRTEQIEKVWNRFEAAALKTFGFFDNALKLKGPVLIPYRYLYMTVGAYLYASAEPDFDFLLKYFWYMSFHMDDLLSNTTQLQQQLTTLTSAAPDAILADFRLDKNQLRMASYSTKGRYSRAILSLLSYLRPRDWKAPHLDVVTETYYSLTEKPNLHHIFPTNFIAEHPGNNKVDVNSLMNIAFITQLTNIKISDKNPVDYVAELDSPEFRELLPAHLVPPDLLEFATKQELPDGALDQFVEKRTELFIETIRKQLPGIPFAVTDTSQAAL